MPSMNAAPAASAAPSIPASAEEAAKAAYLAKTANGPFYSKKTGSEAKPLQAQSVTTFFGMPMSTEVDVAQPSIPTSEPKATGISAEQAAKAAYLAKMADGPFYSKKTGPATSAPGVTNRTRSNAACSIILSVSQSPHKGHREINSDQPATKRGCALVCTSVYGLWRRTAAALSGFSRNR